MTDALINAQGEAFAGMLILRATEENKLDQLNRSDITWALDTIQKPNRDLFFVLEDLARWIEKDRHNVWAEHLDDHFGPRWRPLLEDGAIVLNLRDGFENWCEAQRYKKSMTLANLSLESREKVLATITAIYKQFELSSNPNITIAWVPPSALENHEARKLSLEFLENKDVVRRYKFHYTGGGLIELEIDVKEFFRCRDELLALYAPITGDEESRANRLTPTVALNPFESMQELRWQDITIRFLNGQDVMVSAKTTTARITFKEMGFEDARTGLPNTQWALMRILAENKGQISWEASEAADNVKKKKQLLSETLKAFFQIDDDPFYPYREEKAYRTKFTLKGEGD